MNHPRVRFYGLEGAETVMHSEEHLVLETNLAANYPVGTVLYGLQKHVCPTVALHSYVGFVEDHEYKGDLACCCANAMHNDLTNDTVGLKGRIGDIKASLAVLTSLRT